MKKQSLIPGTWTCFFVCISPFFSFTFRFLFCVEGDQHLAARNFSYNPRGTNKYTKYIDKICVVSWEKRSQYL